MNEEMIRALFLYETEKIMKNEPYDKEIVDFCNTELMKRQKIFTEEDFEESKKQLFEILHGKRRHESPISKIKIKSNFIKSVKITAACFLLIFCIQGVTIALGGNFFDSVYSWSKEMFLSLTDDRIEEDNIVIEASKDMQIYNSIEEFFEAENIYITIPAYMPDNLKITEVVLRSKETEKRVDVFYTNNVCISIYLNQPQNIHEGNAVKYISGNVEYFIFDEPKQVSWNSNGNSYIIAGDFTEDKFKKIIDSLQ